MMHLYRFGGDSASDICGQIDDFGTMINIKNYSSNSNVLLKLFNYNDFMIQYRSNMSTQEYTDLYKSSWGPILMTRTPYSFAPNTADGWNIHSGQFVIFSFGNQPLFIYMQAIFNYTGPQIGPWASTNMGEVQLPSNIFIYGTEISTIIQDIAVSNTSMYVYTDVRKLIFATGNQVLNPTWVRINSVITPIGTY